MEIKFFVPGVPKTAGSKNAFIIRPKGGPPRAIVTDASGKAGKDWRASIQQACPSTGSGPASGAVQVFILFLMPRPKAHYNSKGDIKDSAPFWHTSKPDVLKLGRAVEDALTKLLWIDDSQIFQTRLYKRYVDHDETPGAHIEIEFV